MEANKDIIGQVFFGLSILMLIFMLINPLAQMISNIGEFFTLTLINFPISDILHILTGNLNPPLYYLLLKALSKLTADFGILKVFSIIPYVVILLLSTFKLRKDYSWLTAGLFAFALAIMSQFLITYSLLLPYSWAMLFMILALIYFKEIITTADKKSFILFTIFSLLASYTHYYGLITTIILYLILLFHIMSYDKDKIKYLCLSIIAAVILYIPWISTLINVLKSMNPIGDITTGTIIQSLAHFAYSGDTLFSIITLLIFLIIFAAYFTENDDDKKFVLYSSIAYFATIIAIVIISIILKPILVTNGLVLVSAILWFAISIMISKIQNRRRFLISLALIILLLISGIGTMLVTIGDDLENGSTQQEAIEQMLADNNTIVVLNNPGLAMYFLDFASQTDMYCVNQDYIYGENINRIHEIYDFKTVDKENITDLVRNNSDKNIYLISWGQPNVDLDVTPLSNNMDMVISKVNTTSLMGYEYEYYY